MNLENKEKLQELQYIWDKFCLHLHGEIDWLIFGIEFVKGRNRYIILN